MNILFLSQIVPYPPHGGVLQRGYNLIREIAGKNKVHLLAFVHPDVLKTRQEIQTARQELEKYCAKVEFFDLWVKKSSIKKYSALLLALFSQLPFFVHAHRSNSFKQRVFELTKDTNFDLIHFDTISLSRFIPGNERIPRVVTHHNIESRLMERRVSFENNPLARRYLSLQAKRLRQYEAKETGKYDMNIVMSRIDGEELKKINPAVNIAEVPNGVDTAYFQPGKENGTPSLIYTGGMNMFANKDAVLYFLKDIWPLIKSRVPDIKFYAVGQDPPQELFRLADDDRTIIVTGYVDDIRPLVTAASVYVVPLRVGGGTRLKVLDAMAMGKAIVSTSIGCEGIQVSNEKNIVISDSPADFAEETVYLLKNPDKRKSLGNSARNLVESTYSWKKIGLHLQGIYENTVSQE